MRGYTLIEMMVVLAVLALLASVAMPMAELTVQRDKERELKRSLWEIRDALDAYRKATKQGAIAAGSGASGYPPNLVTLTLPIPDARAGGSGQMIRLLRRIPRDPFADARLAPEQTWGLRSYLSDAENPQSGDDVFDVYSRSGSVGLNGVPLRQW